MLSLHNVDAYGLEISQKATLIAERYASREVVNPAAHNFSEAREISNPETGRVWFIEGDFFSRDWEKRLPVSGGRGEERKGENDIQAGDEEGLFDIIYDPSMLCTLHPEQRAAWATRMQELLKPGGLLICLEFPMGKHLDVEGPPWGMRGVYWDILARREDGMKKDPKEMPGNAGSFDRILHFKPERSFEGEVGEDMLSVWKRKERAERG